VAHVWLWFFLDLIVRLRLSANCWRNPYKCIHLCVCMCIYIYIYNQRLCDDLPPLHPPAASYDTRFCKNCGWLFFSKTNCEETAACARWFLLVYVFVPCRAYTHLHLRTCMHAHTLCLAATQLVTQERHTYAHTHTQAHKHTYTYTQCAHKHACMHASLHTT
jgi:hypothetical protein